jgi:hypothetical protein
LPRSFKISTINGSRFTLTASIDQKFIEDINTCLIRFRVAPGPPCKEIIKEFIKSSIAAA